MTTITWENEETKETKIQIFKSKDKLENVLQQLKGEKRVLETKEGKKKVNLVVKAVSYESKSEKALFRQYGLIPKAKDYQFTMEDDDD